MKRFVWLLMVALGVALATGGCQQPSSEAQTEAVAAPDHIVKVTTMEVRPAPLKDILILPGETIAWQDVVLSSNQGGRVEWVGVVEGDSVKKNDVLVQIDVASLKASLDNAEASRKLAEDLFQRRQALFERKIISREELDQARNQFTLAEGLERQARVAYEHGFIRTPIDGKVNFLNVDPGEYVAQGGAVANVVNVDKIEIDVNVPELDVRYLKKDQPCMVRVDAFPEKDMGAVVDFVSYKADSGTKTFRVKVLLDNPGGLIRPGMIARVAFLKRIIPEGISAPLFSLVDKGGERLVYVEQDGVAHARTVGLGIIDGDVIQITEGLSAGDHLIVTGQQEVQEGTKVQVQ